MEERRQALLPLAAQFAHLPAEVKQKTETPHAFYQVGLYDIIHKLSSITTFITGTPVSDVLISGCRVSPTGPLAGLGAIRRNAHRDSSSLRLTELEGHKTEAARTGLGMDSAP
jgi:hypothetical protein